MHLRRFQLELSLPLQPWHARLIICPEPVESITEQPAATIVAEFDSPLALLEWLERDLISEMGRPGLR